MTDLCLITHVANLDALFPDSSIVVSPGVTRDQLPKMVVGATSIEAQILQFESKYSIWIFEFAELLVRSENTYARIVPTGDDEKRRAEHRSGFAVLGLLNPYFELAGKLTGDFPFYPYKNAKKDMENLLRPKDFIKAGILEVFPELSKVRLRIRQQIVNILYGQIRNPVAHSGLTGTQVILSGDLPWMLTYGDYKGKLYVVIHPHKWYDCLHAHFDDYIEKLKTPIPSNPKIQRLQQLFEQRVNDVR